MCAPPSPSLQKTKGLSALAGSHPIITAVGTPSAWEQQPARPTAATSSEMWSAAGSGVSLLGALRGSKASEHPTPGRIADKCEAAGPTWTWWGVGGGGDLTEGGGGLSWAGGGTSWPRAPGERVGVGGPTGAQAPSLLQGACASMLCKPLRAQGPGPTSLLSVGRGVRSPDLMGPSRPW